MTRRLGVTVPTAGIALALSLALEARPCRADDMDDFLRARDRYVNAEFDLAARELSRLLQGDPVALQGAALRSPARRLYAACLQAQGREDAAVHELEGLLREDPDARADAVQFDIAFVRLFNAVRDRLEPELAQERERRTLERLRAEAAQATRRAMVMQFLNNETLVERSPRALALVPFGVGQFANGQTALGSLFLVTEVLTLAASVGTYLAYDSLRPDAGSFFNDASGVADPRVFQTTVLQGVNVVSVILFVGTAIAGAMHAWFTWQPVRSLGQRPRAVPPELRGLQFSVGAPAEGLTLRF
jgi:hypothetical protein